MERTLLLVASILGVLASQSLATPAFSTVQTLDGGSQSFGAKVGRGFVEIEDEFSYDNAQLNPSLGDLVSGAGFSDTCTGERKSCLLKPDWQVETSTAIDFGDGVGRVPGDGSDFIDLTSGLGLLSTSNLNAATVEDTFAVGTTLVNKHGTDDLEQEDLSFPGGLVIFGCIAAAASLVRNAKGFLGAVIR